MRTEDETMEEPVVDPDVFVVNRSVEGDGDHHGQISDLGSALSGQIQ